MVQRWEVVIIYCPRTPEWHDGDVADLRLMRILIITTNVRVTSAAEAAATMLSVISV